MFPSENRLLPFESIHLPRRRIGGLLRKYLKYAVPFYEDLKITKVNGG